MAGAAEGVELDTRSILLLPLTVWPARTSCGKLLRTLIANWRILYEPEDSMATHVPKTRPREPSQLIEPTQPQCAVFSVQC